MDSAVASRAEQLMALGLSDEECKDPGFQRVWRSAVSHMASLTTPFQNASTLRPMWANFLARACYARLIPEDRLFVDTLHAVAMRDIQGVASNGTKLLQSSWHPANAYETASTVLSVSASLIALDRKQDARVLLERLLPTVVVDPQLLMATRMLIGMTRQADPAPSPSMRE
jgi:hypothetical protein